MLNVHADCVHFELYLCCVCICVECMCVHVLSMSVC
jgi:hypothetical protein